MAYTRAVVNVSGKYAGVARVPGDEISVAGINPKTLRLMVQEGRLSPIGVSALPPSVDSTEAGYLDGLTGNVQEQLDLKLEAADIRDKLETADLADYAKTADLADYVQTSAIANMVETADLADYAQTTALANMVEDSDLAGYVSIASLQALFAGAEDFAALKLAVAAIGV